MRQTKVSQVGGAGRYTTSSLKNERTKTDFWGDETKTIKNAKKMELSHAYRGYASTCNVEILNSFNLELLVKDVVFAIRNKLKDLFTILKGFKLVTKLLSRV